MSSELSRALRFCLALVLMTGTFWRGTAQAQDAELVQLFPSEADVQPIEGDAPPERSYVRLPLSPEILSQVREDFSDIRVFIGAGSYDASIPFTIDRATGPSTRATPLVFEPVYALNPSETTSREGTITRSVETFHLMLPHASNQSGTWVLDVRSSNGTNFVRQYIVRLSATYGGAEVARGAIYQFPEGARTTITLPNITNADFTLELSGEGLPLRPAFTIAEEGRGAIAPPTATVPLAIESTRTEGTQTVYVVNCPEGFPMESFEIQTTTTAFVRNAQVFVSDARGSRAEGSALLVRVPNTAVSEGLLIPTTATGRSVEIRVENRDSPPLEGVVIQARIRVPSLIFEYRTGSILRWGGGRARMPDFDVMNYAVESFQSDGHAVQLGTARSNPHFDNTPLLASSMRAGAVIDTTRFTHEASLTVPESVDGIVRFDVPAEMWAVARRDLNDLRIVDQAGAQWPFLVGNDPEATTLPITVQAPTAHPTSAHVSVHNVLLPVENVVPRVLRFTLPRQPVSRAVEVIGTQRDGTEIPLGSAFWQDSGTGSMSFEVWVNGERVRSLRLEIANGDEAPLALQSGTLEQDGHRLYVVATPGTYRVLVGSSESEPANYDLANFADTVLMLRVESATLGALTANGAYHEPTWLEASGWETVAASAALGLVVLLLFALTLRIVRTEAAPKAAVSASAAESPASPTVDETRPAVDETTTTEAPTSVAEASTSPAEQAAESGEEKPPTDGEDA